MLVLFHKGKWNHATKAESKHKTGNKKTWAVEKNESILWSTGNSRMIEQCCPVRNKKCLYNITWGKVLHFSFIPVLPRSRRANAFSCWINSAADLQTTRLQKSSPYYKRGLVLRRLLRNETEHKNDEIVTGRMSSLEL